MHKQVRWRPCQIIKSCIPLPPDFEKSNISFCYHTAARLELLLQVFAHVHYTQSTFLPVSRLLPLYIFATS